MDMSMDQEAFDRTLTRLKRDMFLAGLCFGASLTGLWCIGAYGVLSALIAGGVIFVAVRGWPWED
jgi:hypothetical protein